MDTITARGADGETPATGTATEGVLTAESWALVERAIGMGFRTFHLSHGAPHDDWYASFFGDPATDRHGAYSRGKTPDAAVAAAFAKLPA